MPLFVWTDAYSVNVNMVDTQHKRLVDMINGLHDSMREGKGNDVIGKLLDEMAAYTVRHFTEEEKLLQQHNYPSLASHKTEHAKFCQRVEELQQKIRVKKMGLSLEVMTFLKDWLSTHILDIDKRYAPYLHERGVH